MAGESLYSFWPTGIITNIVIILKTMNRRTLLGLAPKAPPVRPVKQATRFHPPAPVDSGLEPYQGPWELSQVAHLLRRLLFGAKWEDVQFFLQLSPPEAVNQLLTAPAEPPPVPVNDYNDDNFTDPEAPFGEPWLEAPKIDFIEERRIKSLKAWWLGNLIEQGRSILEKMVVFWHNHIPVEFIAVFFGRWNHRYVDTLRTHALGNYKALVRAITLDPAMLHYLNGQLNSAGAPDENYGRELQELFCIGKGPDSAYTEGDVQAAARVLTGWRVNYETDEVYFEPSAHDTNDKQFSAFYGNTLIAGRTGEDGALELDEMLDMIFANAECAPFLCRKLYRFFVHQEIDNLTEELVILPLAEILRNNNYEIFPVLEALFNSQHFFDYLAKGAMIKSPLDFICGLYQEFNTPIPPRDLFSDRFQYNSTLVGVCTRADLDLGDPPHVAGWPAYYQLPMFVKHWITTSSMPRRAEFIDWILWSGISTEGFNSQLDVLAAVSQLPNPGDPNVLIDTVLAWLYSMEVADEFRLELKSILLSGQVSDYYWTDAWAAYAFNPDDPMARDVVHNRLQSFFHTILQQAEYQLC